MLSFLKGIFGCILRGHWEYGIFLWVFVLGELVNPPNLILLYILYSQYLRTRSINRTLSEGCVFLRNWISLTEKWKPQHSRLSNEWFLMFSDVDAWRWKRVQVKQIWVLTGGGNLN